MRHRKAGSIRQGHLGPLAAKSNVSQPAMSPVDFIHDQFGPAEFRIIRCCLKDCTRSELCIPPDLHLNKSSGISGLILVPAGELLIYDDVHSICGFGSLPVITDKAETCPRKGSLMIYHEQHRPHTRPLRNNRRGRVCGLRHSGEKGAILPADLSPQE